MKAKTALKWTIWTIAILVILAAIAIFLLENHQLTIGRTERLPFYKLYLDALKAILISGLVALASVLIPAIISQANADFRKLKESRSAYSNAKTGVDYLPLRLSSLSLVEAAAHIQQVHVYKHQAELYEELKDHLKRRHIPGGPEHWGDAMYNKLFALRKVLEAHSGEWDALKPDARLKLLLNVVPTEKEA
jgi:hypothetical protein